ncbi:MAG: hypothetical protein LBE13_00040 [Bacteroidales bacterium]|nr:hypothetical protein [Bacteroidales bacterium]
MNRIENKEQRNKVKGTKDKKQKSRRDDTLLTVCFSLRKGIGQHTISQKSRMGRHFINVQ